MSIVYLPRLGTCYNRSTLELELVFVVQSEDGGCRGQGRVLRGQSLVDEHPDIVMKSAKTLKLHITEKESHNHQTVKVLRRDMMKGGKGTPGFNARDAWFPVTC